MNRVHHRSPRGPTDGRVPGGVADRAEAVEVLGTQSVDIRTAVEEPADLVLAVIVKSYQDADKIVASLFCLVKVEVAKCGLLY